MNASRLLVHRSPPAWVHAVLIAVAGLLFLWPALWNGAVFFYWDSVDYIHFPFSWELPVYRTAPYGLFAGLGRLSGSLWTVAVVQALLAAWLLHEAVCVFAPHRMPFAWAYGGAATGLAALTALPWDAGQLMPDAFTGLVVLAVALLAFGEERLSRARRLVVAGIMVLGVMVHTSHIAVAAGLALSLGGARLLLRRPWPEFRPRVLMPGASVLVAIVGIVSVHWATVGRPFIVQPNSVLMLARLVEDGIAKQFLDDTCPKGETYRLCKFRDRLPATANAFLWGGKAIAQQLGGWKVLERRAGEILHRTIELYPLLHLEAAIDLSAEQLARFHTGDGMIRDVDWMVGEALHRYYPDDHAAFRASEQMAGIDFEAVNALHVPIAALSQMLLVGLAWTAWRRRDRLGFGLSLVVVLALLGNAFVCGALSNPNDRYQARIVWTAPLGAALLAARMAFIRRRPEESAPVLSPVAGGLAAIPGPPPAR